MQGPSSRDLAFALAAGVRILQGTALTEHKVATEHFPTFSVAKGNGRVLLTPAKALVTEPRCTNLWDPVSSSLILRSHNSCPSPLLYNEEEDSESLEGLGTVVWWESSRKRAGGVVKQELQPGKAFCKEARRRQINHHGDQWQWCWLRAEARAEAPPTCPGEADWEQKEQGAIPWLSTCRAQVLFSQLGDRTRVKMSRVQTQGKERAGGCKEGHETQKQLSSLVW